MMRKVILSKTVQHKSAKIPNPDITRIIQAIRDLEDKHEKLDIKPLVGRSGYRLKVGSRCLLMDISVYMLVARVDIYKK